MSENFIGIIGALKRNSRDFPLQRAIVCEEKILTWEEVHKQSNQIANKLLSAGYCKGDRAAVLSGNCIEYYLFLLGVVKAGMSIVPIPVMTSVEAASTMLSDSCAQVLIVSESTCEKVESILESMADCPVKLCLGFDFKSDNWNNLTEWIKGSSTAEPDCDIHPEDEFNIIYSSGTTGQPKGIIHSHAFRAGDAEEMASSESEDKNITVITTALYSNYSVYAFLAALQDGGTAILMSKYNGLKFLEICEKEHPTDVFLVPVQIERLLNMPEFGNYSLGEKNMKWIAGSPLSIIRKKEVLELWPGGLTELYGMTEGTPSTSLEAHLHPDKLESVGCPASDTIIKILDDNDIELPTGEIGEIVGHGPTMMTRYNNLPKETSELVWQDKGGLSYFRSGDLGYLDEDGFLYISGRKKDMIISGGFNIYPIDIEEVLLKHDSVKEAAVIGVPCPDWGETPMALIVLKQGQNETKEDLLAWTNQRLGRLQQIRLMKSVDFLPRNSLGKVLKKDLVKQYESFAVQEDAKQ
ncbi:MAG: class I adenylate-forming enzyme family protein [Thermodesulfobacteriota bacterium]